MKEFDIYRKHMFSKDTYWTLLYLIILKKKQHFFEHSQLKNTKVRELICNKTKPKKEEQKFYAPAFFLEWKKKNSDGFAS